jgi:hypothetical protein
MCKLPYRDDEYYSENMKKILKFRNLFKKNNNKKVHSDIIFSEVNICID